MRVSSFFARVSVSVATLLVAVGCAGSGQWGPRIATGDKQVRSADGLYKIDGSKFQVAFAKPGADLGRYSRVMLQPVVLRYRGSAQGAVVLSDKQKERLATLFNEALETSMKLSTKYEIAPASGADVLDLHVELTDIVVTAPARSQAGDIAFTVSPAEMTLLVELADSRTEEVLVRVADRRGASSAGDNLQRSNSVSNWDEVKLLFRRWANLVRRQLDKVDTLPDFPPPAPEAPAVDPA
jgi:hypothetical protein